MVVARKIYSLIFIRRANSLLLGYKTRGLGAGLWNGFGGKVEAGESLLEGAARELKEESNLEAKLLHVGCVTYHQQEKDFEDVVHIFNASSFSGEVVESEEMSPIRWFDMEQLPYEKMWPVTAKWLPLIHGEDFFDVRFTIRNEEYTGMVTRLFKDYNEFKKVVITA